MTASARTVTGIVLSLATAHLPAKQAEHVPFRVQASRLQALLDADLGNYSPAQSRDISNLSIALAGQVARIFEAFVQLPKAPDTEAQLFAFAGVQKELQSRMSGDPCSVEAVGRAPYGYAGVVFSSHTFDLAESSFRSMQWVAFTQSALTFAWGDELAAESARDHFGRQHREHAREIEIWQEGLPIPAVATT